MLHAQYPLLRPLPPRAVHYIHDDSFGNKSKPTAPPSFLFPTPPSPPSRVLLTCAVHYIHDDSFGNKSKPTIRDMRVDIEPYAVHASFRIHNKPSSAVWGWTATESVPIKAAAYLPSSSVVQNFLGGGVSSELKQLILTPCWCAAAVLVFRRDITCFY